jgi:putative two-component system response regulator
MLQPAPHRAHKEEAMEDRVRVLVCHSSPRERHDLCAALATDASFEIVGEAGNTDDAVALALELSPDAILLDIEMPPPGGVAATHQIRGRLPNARLLALIASEEAETVLRVVAAGASGYIVKSSSPDELCQAISKILASPYLDTRLVPTALDSAVHLLRMDRELSQGMVAALAAAVEERDGITSNHIRRVTRITRTLMEHVAPRLLDDLHADYGPLLHDIGKLAATDAILNKPGPLTAKEQIEMRQHVEIGVRILQPIPGFESVRELVRCHHEHWDGGGYPSGLQGEQIPLAARLFAICDAFEAMTSDRPYRRALSQTKALAEIEAQAGHQFDPQAAAQFIQLARANHFAETPATLPVQAA